MIPAGQRFGRLNKLANSLGWVFMVLVVFVGLARLRPEIFGADANYWFRAAAVVTGTGLFGLRWVISRHEKTPGLHWALFGLFMLIQFVDLLVGVR